MSESKDVNLDGAIELTVNPMRSTDQVSPLPKPALRLRYRIFLAAVLPTLPLDSHTQTCGSVVCLLLLPHLILRLVSSLCAGGVRELGCRVRQRCRYGSYRSSCVCRVRIPLLSRCRRSAHSIAPMYYAGAASLAAHCLCVVGLL